MICGLQFREDCSKNVNILFDSRIEKFLAFAGYLQAPKAFKRLATASLDFATLKPEKTET